MKQSHVAGVDYLTVTTTDEQASFSLLDTLWRVVGGSDFYKEPNRPWRFKGYNGRSANGVRYGVRGNECIVMLSGDRATKGWSELARSEGRPTRIDLAVTVTLPEPGDVSVAVRQYSKVIADGVRNGTLITKSHGGSTLYVGSRFSQFYGRLYDKSAEEGYGVGLTWRYEVECKKPAAQSIVVSLLEAKSEPVWIADYVWDWFKQRGIDPMWKRGDTECAIESEATVTTTDRQLKWLHTAVRPTVGRLMVAGLEVEVVEALGLPVTLFDYRKLLKETE